MAKAKKRRPRGLGSAYQRGRLWWITYQHRGNQVREPGGLDGRGARTKEEAEEKLRQRLGEIVAQRYAGPAVERYMVGGLLDDYVAALKAKGAKSLVRSMSHVENARAAFGDMRAVDVTTKHLRQFAEAQLAAGRASGTVNRALQMFRAAFHLAEKEGRVNRVPFFPLLPEADARKGFFEQAEHEAIKAKLPEPHASIAEFGYRTGWRLGEILPLEWANVDRAAGVLVLPDSKNGEGRSLPLRYEGGGLTEAGRVIEDRWAARVYETKDGPAIARWVFHDRGFRVWKFNRVWRKAREAANLPGRLFHDYRRTAARDLVRGGVPRSIAKTITGHKTDSVFDRYNITDDRDKREALASMKRYRRERAEVQTAEISQIHHSSKRRGN